MTAFKRVHKGSVLSISAAVLTASVTAAWGRPLGPVAATLDQSSISVLRVTTGGHSSPADACEEYISHTTHQFINQPAGTPVLIQGGFAEQEIAAAMYTLPASAFPIRIQIMEALFATVATVPTTTKWSVLVWEGPPNLSQSIAEFNSDGVEIPHLQMPAAFGGAQGTVIQMIVDPQDPEQIIIDNAGGSNSFTIGFRIDDHNNQTGNPCFTAPSAQANAFPVTFVDGQQALTGNWLRAINCGALGCPPNGGWTSFQGLNSLCRPSGDWVLRAQWEPASCNNDCYPDCTGESKLTVADFGCFQTRFVVQDPYADCTEDSVFTIADFACFQTKFVQGCP
jgi:hypothetical protein